MEQGPERNTDLSSTDVFTVVNNYFLLFFCLSCVLASMYLQQMFSLVDQYPGPWFAEWLARPDAQVWSRTVDLPRLEHSRPPEDERDAQLLGVQRVAVQDATVLELLGLPPLEDVQGVSLRPLLTGELTDLDLAGYGDSIEHHLTFGSSAKTTWRGHL